MYIIYINYILYLLIIYYIIYIQKICLPGYYQSASGFMVTHGHFMLTHVPDVLLYMYILYI